MLIITILCVLIGAAVGLRFKVYVLVPATGFVVVSVVLTNIAYSDSLATLALAIVTTVIALQIGYLVGIAIRPATSEDRSRRIHGAWLLLRRTPDLGGLDGFDEELPARGHPGSADAALTLTHIERSGSGKRIPPSNGGDDDTVVEHVDIEFE